MSRKTELAAQVVGEHTTLQAAAQAADALSAMLMRDLDAALAGLTRQAEGDHSAAIQQATAGLDRAQQAAIGAVQSALTGGGLAIALWTSPAWKSHTPPTAGAPPSLLRLGEVRPDHLTARLPAMPALLPLVGERHILVSFDDAQSKAWRGPAQLAGLAHRRPQRAGHLPVHRLRSAGPGQQPRLAAAPARKHPRAENLVR